MTVTRAFFAGVLVGTAFAVSMKTSALVLALGMAAFGVMILFPGMRSAAGLRRLAVCVAAALAGALLVPAALCLYFSKQGALHALYYCVIEHNVIPGETKFRISPPVIAFFILVTGLLLLAKRLFVRLPHRLAARRALIFLATGIGLAAAIPAVMLYNRAMRRIAEFRHRLADGTAEALHRFSHALDARMGPEV